MEEERVRGKEKIFATITDSSNATVTREVGLTSTTKDDLHSPIIDIITKPSIFFFFAC